MLLAIAGPAMAGDNNRQEHREERQELREDFLVVGHDVDLDHCCDDDDVEFSEFGFDPFFFGCEGPVCLIANRNPWKREQGSFDSSPALFALWSVLVECVPARS
jgi:hypothetical protein